jgi:hydroxymethylbilane synthase
MNNKPVIVGTRKSQLAVTQTEYVVDTLRCRFPDVTFEIQTFSTAGDRVPDHTALPPHQGIFVKELEEALLGGAIDLAVHSLKDMPCDMTDGLELGAVSEREVPNDALLSAGHVKFNALKAGARIGTSSIRRRAQLLSVRNDLNVTELRGNVDTRIQKLKSGEVDAIVIAAAGVRRLSFEHCITELLPLETFLPAPCQGALAVEIRKNDHSVKSIAMAFNDMPTLFSIMAERAFLRALGGGCSLPVGALASVKADTLSMEVQIVSPDGTQSIRRKVSGNVHDAGKIGTDLANDLLASEGPWLKAALQGKI